MEKKSFQSHQLDNKVQQYFNQHFTFLVRVCGLGVGVGNR